MDELITHEDTPMDKPMYDGVEVRQDYLTADFDEPPLICRDHPPIFQANRTAPLTPSNGNEFTRTVLRGEFSGEETRSDPLNGTGLIGKPQ